MKNFKLNHHTILQCYMVALIALALTGLNACCIPKAPEPADNRIKTFQNQRFPARCSYDNENRIAEIAEEMGTSTFVFSGNSVTENFKVLTLNKSITHTLNADGYVINSPSFFNSEIFTYSYDADNHRTQQTSSNNHTINYTYDANGNLIKKEEIKGGTTTTTTYTYTDKIDLRVDGLDWRLGKRSTNLVATETTNGLTKKYNYIFDNRGRVTLMSVNDGSSTKNTEYTYFN